MLPKTIAAFGLILAFSAFAAYVFAYGPRPSVAADAEALTTDPIDLEPVVAENGFSVEVVIDGVPTTEYAARGRRYVEALENAEYEVRIHNPTGNRVAVALSVDGLNTIDARHTSAWDAHKWVIAPYGTIHVRGWQMSSENARRFSFTTERDSYAAKLGQAANLGLMSAVFFRERAPVTLITPAQPRPYDKEKSTSEPARSSAGEGARDSANRRAPTPAPAYPGPDDESAATGIGRSVPNGVQWIKMDLDPRAVGEVMIRYEYRLALVRLGIIPREYPRPNVLDRRERAQGFEPKYCPQP